MHMTLVAQTLVACHTVLDTSLNNDEIKSKSKDIPGGGCGYPGGTCGGWDMSEKIVITLTPLL